jgi:trimeric autotransporter adhesin
LSIPSFFGLVSHVYFFRNSISCLLTPAVPTWKRLYSQTHSERSSRMKNQITTLLVIALLFAMLFISCSQAVAASASSSPTTTASLFDIKDWQMIGELQGVRGTVHAIARDSQGNLYVGGQFTAIGGSDLNTYNGVAKWDGSRWEALGDGLHNGTVYTIAIDSNDNVYAGGSFRSSNGVFTDGLAKWDGTEWRPLWRRITDLGTADVIVSALHFDASGNLYAGGTFRKIEILNSMETLEASGIAVWNGAKWNAMGAGTGTNDNASYNNVEAIASDSSGNIYAGGRFSTVRNSTNPADQISASGIARWDGSTWSRMGNSSTTQGVKLNHQNGYVYALQMVGNALYVGGFFNTAGEVTTNSVAKWETGSWSSIGYPQTASCYTLTADPAGNIYAGGTYYDNENSITQVFRYNGSQWTGLDHFYGVSPSVNCLLAPANNVLYIGGSYRASSSFDDTRYLSRRIDGKLEPLYYHVNGKVHTVVRAPNGDIYIGGEFTRAGDVLANNIARWDGSRWRAVGTIVGGPNGVNGPVYAIAIAANGRIYAGGSFTTAAGSVSANNVAFFGMPPAGSIQIPQWQALGSGTDGPVRALALDQNQRLIAGGDFVQAGGNTVYYIARWQNSQWNAIGSGTNNSVRALSVDSSGKIYAGGLFTNAGAVSASRIAYYDTTWRPMGSGMNAVVTAIAIDPQDQVYAGGGFNTAGGNLVNYIAKWDGSTWQALGKGILGQAHMVRAITFAPGGRIHVGGDFTVSTDSPYDYAAAWDGSNWASVGNQLNGAINGLAADRYGNVFVGGDFSQISAAPTGIGYSGYYQDNQTSGFHFAVLRNRTLRIAGTNRYSTAIAISRQGWPDGAKAVVLARGDNYPDALAAAPFAYLVDAPILLTVPSQLGSTTLAEIQRLNPDKIYLIGGKNAISESTESMLQAAGYTVQRISGDTRYTTAISIADQMNAHGASFDTAFIVQGTNFPDALSAGAYAAMRGEPILLTPTNSFPPVLSYAMANMNIENTFVIGGEAAVSASVFDQLPNPERIRGASRYLTSIALFERFFPYSGGSLDQIFLSTGENYPDAIAGGVLAAKNGTGLILIYGPGTTPSAAMINQLRQRKINQTVFFGGTGSLSAALETWMRANLPVK